MPSLQTTDTFRTSLFKNEEFTITFELVPGRGSGGKKLEGILKFAEEAKKDGRVKALSITDNPGGHPALAPTSLGLDIQSMGIASLIHFSLKDKNRNMAESQLFECHRHGLLNLLVLGGDYPRYGFHGQAMPVFDLDSPQLLTLINRLRQTLPLERGAPGGVMPLPSMDFLAMERLLARHGLRVARVEELPTHGGSLRVWACARAASFAPESALAMRDLEMRRGLGGDAFYRGFDQRVRLVLDDFRSWMSQSRAQGRRVGAYGAAAKGNTFLNAAGVKADGILAVADRNPVKQGRLLPGSHIPVVSPEELLDLAPDDILILPWNIAPEIVESLRGAGFRGRLLTAVPRMEER